MAGESSIGVYRTLFTDNMRLTLQQGAHPAFAMLSPEEAGGGDLKLLENIVEPRKGHKRRDLGAPTYTKAGTYDRTWVGQPSESEDSIPIDKLEKVAAAIDLGSGFMMSAKRTINRMRDDIWLGGDDGTGGFFGNRMTGKTGSILAPFPAGNIVPVGTGGALSGFNVAKILAAREVLVAGFAENDDQWYIGISAREVTQLFQQYQVASEDFKDSYKVKMSADGKKILGMCGFEFVEFEFNDPLLDNGGLATEAGTGYRQAPFWTKQAMKRVPWYDVDTFVDVLPGRSHITQIRWAFAENQTRTDEKRVGYIRSNPAA